ncbi:hypothetical protein ZIOFF_001328 [Zingiber officinale]|uniref:Uncharacterized protein n=1 Tax=Zingiber officinale TaxID=94328 RepID=A0A8J5HYH3_ZINOF|nr:hypothetical protein ZIOFF_001328 [Zingiber officinale]
MLAASSPHLVIAQDAITCFYRTVLSSSKEPSKAFYLAIIADVEFALLLGDMCGRFIEHFGATHSIVAFSMHEIMIRCKGDELNAKELKLYVEVDKKEVVSVRRLRWNFRGNQAIFVDSSTVDVMWDVHGWWFCDSSRCAEFLRGRVRIPTRSHPDSGAVAFEFRRGHIRNPS